MNLGILRLDVNISKYVGYFHDESLIDIQYEKNNIILLMASAEIDPEEINDDIPYPGDDPAKCPGEGWKWKGRGESGSREGSWYNPETEESLRSDLNHPEPIGPHWDYEKGKEKGRIKPDNTYELK